MLFGCCNKKNEKKFVFSKHIRYIRGVIHSIAHRKLILITNLNNMDIQSIIKTVLSLADVVIKNPSTSVSNSGIDLSSLTTIAGSLLGGASNNANAGGSPLGSILGSALGSSVLGGLGSLLGGGQQQQSQQQTSGGLGDLLGQLTSKAGIINGMLQGNTSQNLSSDQKTNLTDVLNIINTAKTFVK